MTLSLDDAAGRLVRSLVSSVQPAGEHVLRWNGRDGGGRSVSSGVYFLSLQTRAKTPTRRIAVVH